MASVDLVRPNTDAYVLRALMHHRRLTRAELAAEVGISKPTAGESVRRLAERGLVADTGQRTPGGRGRGRVGSYYALVPEVGAALAIVIAPEGVVAECIDVYGDVLARTVKEVDRPAAALDEAARQVCEAAGQPVRLAVVGAADPVDRDTGRLVHLPDSPFLVGELDPVAILSAYTGGAVIVDNDVNWAARAEGDARRDFAYVYLDAGLGCAIVSDGEIRRGRHGLAGEIAHLLTEGPQGRVTPFIEVFGELGLRRAGSTAIDVARLRNAGGRVHEKIGTAVSGIVAALVALADPEEIVLGGSWGPSLALQIRAAVARMPRTVPVRPASGAKDSVIKGVRAEALDRLRRTVLTPVE